MQTQTLYSGNSLPCLSWRFSVKSTLDLHSVSSYVSSEHPCSISSILWRRGGEWGLGGAKSQMSTRMRDQMYVHSVCHICTPSRQAAGCAHQLHPDPPQECHPPAKQSRHRQHISVPHPIICFTNELAAHDHDSSTKVETTISIQ